MNKASAPKPPGFLPDPVLVDGLAQCPACDYSLLGVALPAPCPECGILIPDRALILHGVPRGMPGASPLLKVLAVLSVLVVWLLPQILFATLFPRFGLAGVAIGYAAAFILGIVLAIRAHKRRPGKMSFIIIPSGVGMRPFRAKSPNLQGAFLPLTPGHIARVKRISPFWRTLDIRSPDHGRVIQLGFRCTDAAQATLDEGLTLAFRTPDNRPPPQPPA